MSWTVDLCLTGCDGYVSDCVAIEDEELPERM